MYTVLPLLFWHLACAVPWCLECTLVASHLHIVLLLPLPVVGIAAGGIAFDFLYRMASLLEEGQTASGVGA